MSDLLGPIDALEHPEHPVTPVESAPKIEEKQPNRLGHHKIKRTSTPMITVTLPMSIVSNSTRLLSTLAKHHTFTPVSGLGWAAMGTINGVFKALSWATNVSKTGEAIQALSDVAKEINSDLIDTSQHVRDSRQTGINVVATGAKVLNLVPGVGPLIAGSVDVAAQIASHEAKAEQAVSWWGKQYMKCVFEFLRCSSPTILQGMHSIASKAEEATDWLKQKCYQGMNPDVVEEHLLNWADRTDAIRWKLIYSQEEEAAPLPTEEKAKKSNQSHLSIDEFKQLSLDEQEDILFLVFDSSTLFLSEEKKQQISEAVQHVNDSLIQELLTLYNSLPSEEKYKITPADFRALDDLEKIKALRLSLKSSKTVSQEELDELASFSHMRVRQDAQSLTKEEKEKLEKLVISAFNRLSPSVKNKINNFSYEQIEELSKEDKKTLFNLAFAKVVEKGTNGEKAHFALLKKSDIFDKEKDLKMIASCLNRYLDAKEKALLLGSLKERFAVMRLSSEDLAQLIEQTANQLATLPTSTPKAEKEELETQLEILRKYEKEHAFHQAIDMNKILRSVGPEVVSKGTFYDIGKTTGETGETSLRNLGLLSTQALNQIGSSRLHGLIETLTNKAALALQLMMVVPFGKDIIASFLLKSGVPIYKIEAAFSKIPSAIAGVAISSEEAVVSGLKTASQAIDSTASTIITTSKHLENVEALPELEKHVEELSQNVESAVTSLTQAITQECLSDQDKLQKLICSTDVLQSPEKLISYAQELNLEISSPEFLSVITEMALSGHVPPQAKSFVDTAEIAGQLAGKTSEDSIASWTSWFANSLQELFDTISETRVAEGMSHLKQAVETSPIGTLAGTLHNEAIDKATKAKEFLTEATSKTLHEAKKAVGLEQPLSKAVQKQLAHFADAAAKLAETKGKIEAAQISKAALLELNSTWDIIIKKSASSATFAQFVKQVYQGTIGPMISQAMSSVEALHLVNQANYKFLDAQMDANLRTEMELKQFLADKAKIATKNLEQEESAAFKQTVLDTISSALPVLSWVFTSGHSLTVLPFIMQRMLPHMLRSAATCIGNGSQFWFHIAKNAQYLSDKSGSHLKSSAIKTGSWLQKTFQKALGDETIDPERVKNFFKLTLKEQHHIFELAINSSKISSQEQKQIEALLAKFPEQILNQELHTLIEQSLRVMDRLSSQELLALSPTSFFALDKTKQNRIREIVHRYTKSPSSKILTGPELARRFNCLPESKRQEVQCKTIKEFFELSNEEQEAIFFTVAHSEQYKHFTDNDPSRIVRKYNELPEEFISEVTCLSEAQYKKLSLSDQEKVRMTIALHTNYLKDIHMPTLIETMEWEHQMAWNLPTDWEFRQFKSLDHISNHRLRNILRLHGNLTEQESQILTPNRLKEMGEIKIHQMIEIIQTYHPELPQKYSLNLNRLARLLDQTPFIAAKKEQEESLKALCSLFHSLPPGQKAQLLQMTSKEFQSLDKEEKKELVMYLMTSGKYQSFFQEQLVLLFSDKAIDETQIISHFNELGSAQQAEWRQTQYVERKQRESILQSIEHQSFETEKKLRAVEKRISKLSDNDFLAFSARLELLQENKTTIEREIASEQITYDSIKEALEQLPSQHNYEREENLKGLKIDISKKREEISTIETKIKELDEKKSITAEKIAHLNELKLEWQSKLISLRKLAGKDPEAKASIAEESDQTTKTIDAIITATIHEVSGTTEKAILNGLERKINNPVEFTQAVGHARELFSEIISIYKEHVQIIKDKIEALQKETPSQEAQKRVERELQLRALQHFNLKMNTGLLEKFQGLQIQFEKDLRTIEYRSQMSTVRSK